MEPLTIRSLDHITPMGLQDEEVPVEARTTLASELATLFPDGEVVVTGLDQIVDLVRELKRDGSDFLVEEDLAAIFGRGKIEPSLEDDFCNAVKTESNQLLYANSQISLNAGPATTVRRALKDRHYLSSVIQLSFLAWMHNETSLAKALLKNMLRRCDSKVQGATADPDYDGILKTLRACSSQTSQYRWDDLVLLVENRFKKSRQWFCVNGYPLRKLSTSLLLGAMDYLYIVQSSPRDRYIKVESQEGVLPIIIWAHYILGLTVLVENSLDGDVAFGGMERPQVIISWCTSDISDMMSPNNSWVTPILRKISPPTIHLLNAEMSVLLTTELDVNDHGDDDEAIYSRESHRLRGYGARYLQMFFNSATLMPENAPIFAETANFAVTFALLMSRMIRRFPFPARDGILTYKDTDVPKQCCLGTEHRRLLYASSLLFWGIKLDEKRIFEHAEEIGGKRPKDIDLPASCESYIQLLEEIDGPYDFERLKDSFLWSISHVATWIIAFAQVVDLESCADLPLSLRVWSSGLWYYGDQKPLDIDSNFWFKIVRELMHKSYPSEGYDREYNRDHQVFLDCQSGWSLFYGCVGDHDPQDLDSESLYIKRGVPTDRRTGERKYQIVDTEEALIDHPVPSEKRKDKRNSYLPRRAMMVHRRTESYKSKADAFILSIQFGVRELIESQDDGREERRLIYASYGEFHRSIWRIIKTLPCPHGNQGPVDESGPLPLDPETKTVGMNCYQKKFGDPDFRINVCLVKGDARARWIRIFAMSNFTTAAFGRRLLLRCDGCCDDCAVKYARESEGQWLVIL